jgi:hypothetical protein
MIMAPCRWQVGYDEEIEEAVLDAAVVQGLGHG